MMVNISWISQNNFNCILNYSHKGIFIFVITYGATFDFSIHSLTIWSSIIYFIY